MKINQLIANAQSALDAIAQSPEFAEILDRGLWDAPSTTLSDCSDCLQELLQISAYLKVQKPYVAKTTFSLSSLESFRNL